MTRYEFNRIIDERVEENEIDKYGVEDYLDELLEGDDWYFEQRRKEW